MATSDLEIAGRVALVTGAARGIGLGTAQALHRRGAAVVVVDLDQDAAAAAAAGIGAERTLGLACDVTDEAAVEAAIAATVDRFGGLDIAVANAGVAPALGSVRATDHAAFDLVLDVNLHGVVNTARQALPQIIERQGHILVIASVYAFVNGVLGASYAMSKAAVEQLGRALRVELAPYGASAGVGYFGFVDTAMVEEALSDPVADELLQAFPRFLHKRISPTEAGEALAAGIGHRAPRTIRPRRWIPYSLLRGLINPLFDKAAAADDMVRAAITKTDPSGAG